MSVAIEIPFRVLGLAPEYVTYADALEAQEATAERVREHQTHGELYLLEHESVYTAGRRADPAEYPTDGTPVVETDRGGKVTWHGPGQLVGYPVMRLAQPLKLVPYVRHIEQAIIDTLAELDIHGFRVDGRSGVWVNTGLPWNEKIMQVGIHAKRGIVTHGFALNCSCDLGVFHRFIPCGITDAGVTSISQVLGRRVTPADVLPIIRPHLETLIREVADL